MYAHILPTRNRHVYCFQGSGHITGLVAFAHTKETVHTWAHLWLHFVNSLNHNQKGKDDLYIFNHSFPNKDSLHVLKLTQNLNITNSKNRENDIYSLLLPDLLIFGQPICSFSSIFLGRSAESKGRNEAVILNTYRQRSGFLSNANIAKALRAVISLCGRLSLWFP